MTFSRSLACPHCGVAAGEDCVTASGRPTREGNHHARWDALRSARRSREMVFRLKADDPRFKLTAGDELVCENYPYDAKVTVLYRLSDGFDPQCNQYTQDVEFLRWHDPSTEPAAGPTAAERCSYCSELRGQGHKSFCLTRMEGAREQWTPDNAGALIAFCEDGGATLLPWQESYVRAGMPAPTASHGRKP